ncbi:MAG: LapA family protein [Pseudomonadota bacterium]
MKSIAKFITIVLFIALFVIFFDFALRNSEDVTLHFFLNYQIRRPLALFLLTFLVGGFVMGVLAMTPTLFRNRRQLSKNKKAILSLEQESVAQQKARTQQPSTDTIVTR